MSGNYFQVEPRSKKDIRQFAALLRSSFGYTSAYWPVERFLERDVELLTGGRIRMEVWEDKDMRGAEGLSFPDEGLIVLPEKAVVGIANGDGRSRFTGMHEFSHVALGHRAGYARASNYEEIPAYMNSEWQADFLSGELLAPCDIILRLKGNIDLISSECGISRAAANTRVQICIREGIIK